MTETAKGQTMGIQIYNTLTRRKEAFEPVHEGRVSIYLCGPTVYMPSHIGHAIGPIIFDCIKRYLVERGYEVTLVVNITDVDDKLIARARRENTTVEALAEKVTALYFDSMRDLGVTSVDHYPKATEHIEDIIKIVKELEAKGYAYAADGSVYFDVSKKQDYGKLSRRRTDELVSGTRVEMQEAKRNPLDFALWKAAKEGEPAWDSPWGKGRPGWHIECSAMSMKYLGDTIDIHGGGEDLIFPHHENEVAQSECATGKPFATYWMHNGTVRFNKEKMSKSLGNVVTIGDLLKEFTGEQVRFFVISTHYRQPTEFSRDRLRESARALEGFYRLFERVVRTTGKDPYDLAADLEKPSGAVAEQLSLAREVFFGSMDDDFNTARALAALFELVGAINRFIEEHCPQERADDDETGDSILAAAAYLRRLGMILGLFERRPEEGAAGGEGLLEERLIELVVDLRSRARGAKDFETADYIRAELAEMGITLEDFPERTEWRRSIAGSPQTAG